jgi:hypothetical protein
VTQYQSSQGHCPRILDNIVSRLVAGIKSFTGGGLIIQQSEQTVNMAGTAVQPIIIESDSVNECVGDDSVMTRGKGDSVNECVGDDSVSGDVMTRVGDDIVMNTMRGGDDSVKPRGGDSDSERERELDAQSQELEAAGMPLNERASCRKQLKRRRKLEQQVDDWVDDGMPHDKSGKRRCLFRLKQLEENYPVLMMVEFSDPPTYHKKCLLRLEECGGKQRRGWKGEELMHCGEHLDCMKRWTRVDAYWGMHRAAYYLNKYFDGKEPNTLLKRTCERAPCGKLDCTMIMWLLKAASTEQK